MKYELLSEEDDMEPGEMGLGERMFCDTPASFGNDNGISPKSSISSYNKFSSASTSSSQTFDSFKKLNLG